jgi:hypothetical protein
MLAQQQQMNGVGGCHEAGKPANGMATSSTMLPTAMTMAAPVAEDAQSVK